MVWKKGVSEHIAFKNPREMWFRNYLTVIVDFSWFAEIQNTLTETVIFFTKAFKKR